MDRRRFLHCLAVAGTAPALPRRAAAGTPAAGALRPDPQQILDLPAGFRYEIVSRAGDRMADGLVVPRAHDGMAAFPGPDGRIILVCNHELEPGQFDHSAFTPSLDAVPAALAERIFDRGGDRTPGTGGTTTTVWDPATGKTERQHLSLAGTELNCAGGPTPWGSWLSCEECIQEPGIGWSVGRIVRRDRRHGYVFEVPAAADGLVEPAPLEALGRFEHEAAAVDARTGIVYLTEDRHHSLFYRFIPDEPGNLARGGRLEALAIDGPRPFTTHNWARRRDIAVGRRVPVHWIPLENVDNPAHDLRERGAEAGAATFARGEGLTAAGDTFVFTCTIGGPARLGQLFAYRPSPHEGRPAEAKVPGHLTLIAESTEDSLLRNADNLTQAPWGDLIVCEDTAGHCGLVGIRPDGKQYAIADNAYTDSELAGVCFSPDGRTLFVNIQYPGMTLAITGPWPT